jgi:transcriptional regulator with XRE-family HTH domain
MLREAIVQARINKGLSMRQVALYAKVPIATLSRFENNKGDLHSHQLSRVLIFLGFSVQINSLNILKEEELQRYLAPTDND